MPLVHIVPRLPPATDGLGDYALKLAGELRVKYGIESRFIVCDPTWASQPEIEGFPIERLKARSTASLQSSLINSAPFNAILLHYVGYGYARRGAPVWLVEGLEKWQKGNKEACLLTMFHEISASGPFWTSAFWLSSLQRHLAARLTGLSHTCLTSMQYYAQILGSLSRNKHNSIVSLPVFSNIGEPEQTPLNLKERKRRLVVFGGHSNRWRVYKKSLDALEEVCRALAIEEVFDVGPPADLIMAQINGVPLVQRGQRSAAEVSAILSDSIAGFFDYNTAFLAKSTIFAAYSAHRLIPISASREATQADGLEAGIHYWTANDYDTTLSLEDGQRIADNAYAWYQTHNLSVQAERFISHLNCFSASWMVTTKD